MMKSWRAALAATAIAGAGAGCVTNGDDFPSDTAWIKENTTKQQDVRSVLGEPYSVGASGGKKSWTYGYYRYRLFGKSFQKELKFYWNPDGTVSHYSFTSSFPGDTGKAGADEERQPVDLIGGDAGAGGE